MHSVLNLRKLNQFYCFWRYKKFANQTLVITGGFTGIGEATATLLAVANLVEFLLSEKSSFITGSLFSIDGGFVAQ